MLFIQIVTGLVLALMVLYGVPYVITSGIFDAIYAARVRSFEKHRTKHEHEGR